MCEIENMVENPLRLFIRETGGYPGSLVIPEVSNGFDVTLPSLPFGMVPVSFWSDRVPAGIYEVRIRLKALEDIERLYLFTGRKQASGDPFHEMRGEPGAGILFVSGRYYSPLS